MRMSGSSPAAAALVFLDTTTAIPLVGVRVAEGAALEHGEVGGSLACDTNLVAVLEVGAYTGKVDDDGDVEALELGLGADSTELEELRSVEGACGDDDFLGSGDVSRGAALRASGARVSGVEALALEVFNADCFGDAAVVEADLGCQREHLDVEVVLAGSILVNCVGLLKR
jgi:hypothetical protein